MSKIIKAEWTDPQIRLFYGACDHAKRHTSTVKEFEVFKGNVKELKTANRIFLKAKRLNTGRFAEAEFSDEELAVCKKLLDCELALLRRLDAEFENHSGEELFIGIYKVFGFEAD